MNPHKSLSEYDEQCLLVEYLELKRLKFSKTAQETWAKNWGVIMKNKKSGVRKGLPDMLIIIPRKKMDDKLIFIEMKKKKGSTTTQEQKEWQCALNRCEGVNSYICKGFEEAKEVIDEELRCS